MRYALAILIAASLLVQAPIFAQSGESKAATKAAVPRLPDYFTAITSTVVPCFARVTCNASPACFSALNATGTLTAFKWYVVL